MEQEKVGRYDPATGDVEREFWRQGYIFKDPFIYATMPDEICYIGELSDAGYTANDFLRLANGDINLANKAFEMCDWQSPATFIDELLRDGDAGICLFCGQILSSSRDCICRRDPFTGDVLPEGITGRQYQILKEVAAGKTNIDIASAMGLAETTIKNHVQNILKLLGLTNRTELARYYYTNIWGGRK